MYDQTGRNTSSELLMQWHNEVIAFVAESELSLWAQITGFVRRDSTGPSPEDPPASPASAPDASQMSPQGPDTRTA